MKILNTLTPYQVIPYEGIQYGVCYDYSHISRYRGLRQLTHNPKTVSERFMTLELSNPFKTSVDVQYYEVLPTEENRLDLISYKFYSDPTYGWVIAYFNDIEDGYTVKAGQIIQLPESVTALFGKGEVLAAVSPSMLNLGSE